MVAKNGTKVAKNGTSTLYIYICKYTFQKDFCQWVGTCCMKHIRGTFFHFLRTNRRRLTYAKFIILVRAHWVIKTPSYRMKRVLGDGRIVKRTSNTYGFLRERCSSSVGTLFSFFLFFFESTHCQSTFVSIPSISHRYL